MAGTFAGRVPIHRFSLWEKAADRRVPLGFDLEITARCNLNCRHCAVNLPAGDQKARQRELSVEDISRIADQAVSLGALWCLITGGEPLLRDDFGDIYRMLRKKGLLVSVFTNACLVTDAHIELFTRYPPRDLEITVYGITRSTYERVTRIPGSFAAFEKGMDRLIGNGIPLRMKAMALRSNHAELPEIAAYCRRHTRDFFRFDSLLHLRYDKDRERNRDIVGERLNAEEIVKLEHSDPQRSNALRKHCDRLTGNRAGPSAPRPDLFTCGAGKAGFTVSPEGIFRLCQSLWHPDFLYDLQKGSLHDAWHNFVPRVRARTSRAPEFLENCSGCPLINLCLWCPAHAYLECGKLDGWIGYFCEVAHARARALGKKRESCGEKRTGKGE